MPISNNIVTTRPAFDLPTRYLSYWLGITVEHAKRLRYNVADLAGADATKEKLYQALVGLDPLFFLGGGHGEVDVFTGDDRQVLLNSENAYWMAERLTYLFSCLTGQKLSKDIIGAGGEAFLGYNEEFGFVVSPPYIPATDPKARGFMEAGNAIALSLLRGYSVGDAYNAGVKKFNDWIAYWEKSTDPLAPLILTWLESDRDSLVAWGNSTARLSVEKREEHPTGLWPAFLAAGGVITGLVLATL